MTLHAEPAQLTASVLDAVAHGAWAASEVTATVTADVRAQHSDVLATLWDLVDEGTLAYDEHLGAPGFRVAQPALS